MTTGRKSGGGGGGDEGRIKSEISAMCARVRVFLSIYYPKMK